jgi:hypothetical protein
MQPELDARQVPYDKETLDGLRAQYASTHAFRRLGDNILIFSGNGMFPALGTPHTVALKDNFGIFCSLVKDGLKRHLAVLGRNPSGFNPIELVSTKPEDNLLTPILGDTYQYCMEDLSTVENPITDPSKCPQVQQVAQAVDAAAVNVFDGWAAHVTVGPLQQVNVANSSKKSN